LEVLVFKLQKRIYQASSRGDVKLVHQLQKLLFKSESAKLLAVRRVTQDNRGRKTAGVDGVASLKPKERLQLAEDLKLKDKSDPVRRVWIPKSGKTEMRGLGIPTIATRAEQTLVKLVLEPEWEAKFEPNSYGFRPGRSCHDSCEAIYQTLIKKTALVLDADISGCFDNIDQTALLAKLATTPTIRRTIKGWLKSGVIEGNIFQSTEKGTMQGGSISPLLANIALHGMELDTKEALTEELFQSMKKKIREAKKVKPFKSTASRVKALKTLSIIRYADDFVVIHENEEMLIKAKVFIEEWLKKIGLELNTAKTRMVHTLNPMDKQKPGFDFLGFTVRQFSNSTSKKGCKTLITPSKASQKQHAKAVREQLRSMRATTQEDVIKQLNPIINGWSRYFTPVVASKVFNRLDSEMFYKLWKWAVRRHPQKGAKWIRRKYFREHGNNKWRFKTHEGELLARHRDHYIKRYTKVLDTRSPYDGDWVYWSTRLGRSPGIAPRKARLLKIQNGKCKQCKLWFNVKDKIELHHIDQNRNNNRIGNLGLLHLHCHDTIHGTRYA
jgi:RNA-directed DNA polymerase